MNQVPHRSRTAESIRGLRDNRLTQVPSERDPSRKFYDNQYDDKTSFFQSFESYILQSNSSVSTCTQPDHEYAYGPTEDQRGSYLTSDLYQDKIFTPNEESIFGTFEHPEAIDGLNEFINAKWRSIFWSHHLFLGKIEYKDVLQTFLGDCYFLAVVCGLAKIKERILALFSPQKSLLGLYEVVCYYMGEKWRVELDSYFPFKDDETVTGTNGKESWVLFLEKAFAKVFGSYAAIIGGNPLEAMRFLTGAPAEQFLTAKIRYDDSEEVRLWQLLAGQSCEHIWTCCTGPNSEKLQRSGLAGDHAYTILAAFETNFDDKILVIRNPWGRKDHDGNGEFRLRWSDKYLRRHIEDLKKLPYEYQGTNDGLFHISYDDFLEYFESAEVCYLHSKFDLLKEKGKLDSTEMKSFPITVLNQKTSFYIIVNQESHRRYSEFSGYLGFEYSEISFNVYDSTGKQIFDNDITGKEQQVWKKVSLPRGKYKVAIRIRWSSFALQHGIKSFVLNTYGPKNIKLNSPPSR